MYNWDFLSLINVLPLLQKGLEVTVFVSFVSGFFAFLIALVVAYIRGLDSILIKKIVSWYIEITRNIPLLIQLYIVYKLLPHVGLHFAPITCGIITLSIYTAAYIAEVLRSGLRTLAYNQNQAAYALGLSYFDTFFLISFPQAIRIVIPALISQFINLIKNSSLVSFIAVVDVFYVIYKGACDDFRIYEYFIVGAAIYMMLTWFVAFVGFLLEKSLKIRGREVSV